VRDEGVATNKILLSEHIEAKRRGDKKKEAETFEKLVDHNEALMLAAMAPPGGIAGLSPLLEARRLQYAIPNGAFKIQAAFDVCLVHQIERPDQSTFVPGGKILMSPNDRRRDHESTPKGVLVAAGLQALDHLRSNGIEVGHIVTLIRQAPWRMPIDNVGGHEKYLLILRTGDITGSEDLREAIAAGKCRIEWNAENSQHIYVDEQGQRWNPTVPFLPADY
jgi:hypothetical protein